MARLSSTERRTELVRAALRVIDREGVHAASTRAIVAEAQMPLASFHYAVASRDALIRDVIMAVTGDERAAAVGSLTAGVDLRTAIRAGFQAYFELLESAPGHEQAMFELFHYTLRTPGLADLPSAQYARYHSIARDMLDVAAQHTGASWMVPVGDVARLLVALTDGLTLAWLADHDAQAAARTMDLASDALAALARGRSDDHAPTSAPTTAENA